MEAGMKLQDERGEESRYGNALEDRSQVTAI